MKKKSKLSKLEELRKIVNDVRPAQEKDDITLRIDKDLLDEGRELLKGKLGAIFEHALEQALEVKRGKKK